MAVFCCLCKHFSFVLTYFFAQTSSSSVYHRRINLIIVTPLRMKWFEIKIFRYGLFTARFHKPLLNVFFFKTRNNIINTSVDNMNRWLSFHVKSRLWPGFEEVIYSRYMPVPFAYMDHVFTEIWILSLYLCYPFLPKVGTFGRTVVQTIFLWHGDGTN